MALPRRQGLLFQMLGRAAEGGRMMRTKVVVDCPWCDAAIDVAVFEHGAIQMCWNCHNMTKLSKGKLLPMKEQG